MAVFKKTYVRKIPDGAKIVTRKGKEVAQWVDRKGKKRSAEVTTGNDGNPRIKTEATTYTAKYRDGEGKVCEVATGCTDKDAARSVLAGLRKRAELVKAKVISPDQDRIADHQKTPVADHITAYIDYQRDRGRNADHIKNYQTRLTRSADECRFRWLSELNADRLEKWLSTLAEAPRAGDGDTSPQLVSASVYNGYVEAWVAFGNWMIGKRINGRRSNMQGEKRLLVNPFGGIGKRDKSQDRRRVARAMTEAELSRLLKSARERPVVAAETVRRGPNKGERLIVLSDDRRAKLERLGAERALIYKTAILTGLRKGELRSMSVCDLSFGDVPFVKLQARNEKNRQGSTLPIRSDLAAELRTWIAGKSSTDPVFRVPSGLLDILDKDIEAAGIPKIDAEGRVVHFHALRHSFGTHLSRSGVTPRVAQAAMRHSNISLTMTTYTDPRLLDTAAAVESLPDFDAVNQTEIAARCSDAPTDAPKPGKSSESGSIADNPGEFADDGECRPGTKKPRDSRGFTDAVERTRTSTGLTPTRPST